MRIGFLTGEWPGDNPAGGIGVYTLSMANTLANLGHDVHIFAPSTEPCPVHVNEQVIVHPITLEAGSGLSLHARLEISALHQSHPFDAIEAPDLWHLGLELKRELCEIPLVVRLHTPVYLVNRYQRSDSLLRSLFGMTHRLLRGTKSPWHVDFGQGCFERIQAVEANAITAPSRAVAERISTDWRIAPERITVVPNGVEIPDVTTSFEGRNLSEVLFVGRLDRLKGILELVEAMRLVFNRFPNARLSLIGKDGQWEGKPVSEHIAHRLADWSDRWRWLGVLPREECLDRFRTCGVAVFPSHWESFGLACAEAMSVGTPIIASSVGGLQDLIDGASGIGTKPGSVRSIEAALTRILSDPAYARQLGERAYTRCRKNFSINQCANSTIQVYEKVMKGKHHGSSI